MKRKLITLLSVCLATLMLCAFCLAGCFGGNDGDKGGNDKTDDTPKEYTIQYTTDSGTVKLTVKQGDTYSLDVIPEKTGYDFLGLFDAETGGTQFVLANGSSAATFTGSSNLVLYPQYKAKSYNVILDYQGAPVTGSRQITVTYGTSLPELPKDLQAEHKEFTGWYTQAESGGVQVADKYGLIPLVSVFNEENFDFSAQNITLYAGFETEKVTVTCHYDEGEATEEIKVDYNSPVSSVLTKKRKDGNAVLTWSKTKDGEVYNGKITEACDLYAVEYAPVLELDLDGGKGVNAVVARAGSAVALPVPEKELSKFSHWEDMGGNEYTSTTMPTKSAYLKAVWQAKLVFDENGGSDVQDISVKAGEKITLPMPEKEGFIFAGWYNANKEQYTSTTMPAAGIKLKAGWYKAKSVKKDFLSGTDESSIVWCKNPWLRSSYNIDFTEEISDLDWTKSVNVFIEFHAEIKHISEHNQIPTYPTKEHFYYYSQEKVNDAYLLSHIIVDHGKGAVSGSYTTTAFSAQMTVTGGKVYAALAADKDMRVSSFGVHYYCGWRMKNFWAEIFYPDMTNLYL